MRRWLRLSLFVPISKNIETHYREGNLIAQADYAWGKSRTNGGCWTRAAHARWTRSSFAAGTQ
ncbi:MAG: hypothetical protein ACM3NQ_24930 [Bacteroidales bacterium]